MIKNESKIFDYGEVKVQYPNPDSKNWYTIEQQSFTIDKNEFILEKFKEDFPRLKIKDYSQFELVLSRSEKLQDWYSKISLLYADSIQLPVAFKDIFNPKEYQQYFIDMQEYKSELANESNEIFDLSNKFDTDLLIIKNKYKEKLDNIIAKDKVYPILTLRASQMPLSIQIEIENFTPKINDNTNQKSLFARELLINYQRSLLELVKNDPTVDILGIIESNLIK